MKTKQQIALITGGNRGLGLQTALELAPQNVMVIIGARNPKSGAVAAEDLRAKGYAADSLVIDVADPLTHKAAFDLIEIRYGRLDILINNAGVWKESATSSSFGSRDATPSTLSMEVLRETFETNFFGTVALTQRLLPLIRKSVAGRIVNVSSIMGSLTLHSDPSSPIHSYNVFGYDTSKAALNSFTIHLAHELRGTSIKVNSAHPGWVKTDMGGEGADLEVSEGGKTSAQLALLPTDGPTGGFFHMGQSLPW